MEKAVVSPAKEGPRVKDGRETHVYCVFLYGRCSSFPRSSEGANNKRSILFKGNGLYWTILDVLYFKIIIYNKYSIVKC